MSEISASYQPNKIKRKGYTSWIDESNQFCTTAGITLDKVRGQNLMDAFDVDWSAYEIDGQAASATSIINKLNTPATAINNFLGVLLDQDELLKEQNRSTKGGSYWIVGNDIDIYIDEKLYKSLHAGDQVIINVGADDYEINNEGGFDNCYYCVQINMSGYIPITGTRDKLPLSGSIVVENWAEKALDAEDALIHLKFNADEENSIFGAEEPCIPILGYTDPDGNFKYLMDICFFDKDFDHPKIGFNNGICPVGGQQDIGHPDDPFNIVYADRFIKTGGNNDKVLLDGGGVKPLSEFTPDLSGYLPLTGGTMTGDIIPNTDAPGVGMVSLKETYNLGNSSHHFNEVYARSFKGLADGAWKVYGYENRDGSINRTPRPITRGDNNTPVYFNEGVPVECDWSFTNFATTEALDNYLPLTGGTMSGDILPSTSAPPIGLPGANVSGQPIPTYISLGSDDKYFDKVYAREFKGLADKALKLYTYETGILHLDILSAITKGNASKPVYFKDGVPVECNSIPTVNDGTLTLKIAGTGRVTHSANASTNSEFDVPEASADAHGVIKVSSKNTSAVTVNTKSTIAGRYYPVELNNDGKAIVNVPWNSTDSKVTQSRATNNGAYPLLCKYDTTNATTTNSVNFVSDFTVNPSTKTITAPKLNISWSGPGGDDWNKNVKYPVTNKALVIGQADNGSTCLYINRFGIQAWNWTTDTESTYSNIPSMYLQGAGGNIICGGAVNATAFYETSDIRKKDIKSDLSLDKCYDLIDKCQTVIYSLKDQTKEQIGMIAQEIEEFFPEVVATDEEGFKSLAYDRLVVICFKVLKDVIKRLEKLETK